MFYDFEGKSVKLFQELVNRFIFNSVFITTYSAIRGADTMADMLEQLNKVESITDLIEQANQEDDGEVQENAA